ncbi:MAG: hypothetical protein ABFE13_12135 [Phycisphaerales bacterium]
MTDFAVTNVTWDDDDVTAFNGTVGTAIEASKTAVITPTGPLEELVVLYSNTYAGAIVPIVEAGDNPPAMSAGIGNLTLTTLANSTGFGMLPPLESARFLQSNGTLRIQFPANAAGYIIAFQKPHVKAT